MAPLKLVLFDALHTLITPRLPIHIQYAQVFEPYLGSLDPILVRGAFKSALKEIQQEKPIYVEGKERWWGDIITRTAIGAGADPRVVNESMDAIVSKLLKIFSGKQGYKAFDDAAPTLKTLKEMGLRVGIVSNTDSRMKYVLLDLGLSGYLNPVLVSEEEGVEKPMKEIWLRACLRAGMRPDEALHVGDDVECDYHGAKVAGLSALLLRRTDEEQIDEDLTGVETISNLTEVVTRVASEGLLRL